MKKYEYETVEIDASAWTSRTSRPKDLEETLNQHATQGWQMKQIIAPAFAGFNKYIVIFERVLQ
jgi:hypothetical protein